MSTSRFMWFAHRLSAASFAACAAIGAAADASAQPAPPAQPPAAAASLTVPDGFGVSVFASGLTGGRLMAISPEGTLVLARRAEVVALPDADGDGVAEPRVLFSNLTYAHSVAFANGYLYIATTPAVLRVRWDNGAPVGEPEPIVELPSDKPSLHTSRSLGIGPDGMQTKSGVFLGTKIDFIFQSLTVEAVGARTFDELKIPYRAVAADLASGKPVVLDRGDLALAMRASMALSARANSSTMVKWFAPGTTTHSALTPARLQAPAMARLWRTNSWLSSPPTAATSVRSFGGAGHSSGLISRALAASSFTASLMVVPISGARSKTPLRA